MTSPPPAPKRIKAGLEDQIFYWMTTQFDAQNHAVMHMSGRLDEVVLEQAVHLALKAEPVLVCRYVPATWRQYWEPMAHPEKLKLVTMIAQETSLKDVQRFLEVYQPIDHLKGPQVHVYILRGQADLLIVKISHVVSDGGGVKDFCYLIADIYTKLLTQPDYAPPVNPNPERSLTQVTRHFKLWDMVKILGRSVKDLKGIFIPFIFRKPIVQHAEPGDRAYEILTLEKDAFNRLKAYAQSLNVTINDVITALYFRAFYTCMNNDPRAFLRLVITVNLRRFIPGGKAASICGLSGFTYMNIGRHPGATLTDTVGLVHRHMNWIKNDYPGLGGSFPLTWLFFKTLPYKFSLYLHTLMSRQMQKQYIYPGNVAPLLTNTGVLEKSCLNFGGAYPERLFFSAPLSYPPMFATTVTTYESEMTLCVGFCEKTLSRETARRIFSRIMAELP